MTETHTCGWLLLPEVRQCSRPAAEARVVFAEPAGRPSATSNEGPRVSRLWLCDQHAPLVPGFVTH